MKTLFSTTALVVALGFPALTLAQEAAPAANPVQQQSMSMSGFLAARGQSDINASVLIGHDVYARSMPYDAAAHGDAMSGNAAETDGMAMMTSDDLDGLENIGQINDIVLSSGGQVRALVIAVGGFLGMGDHDVAVALDQVAFAVDADDRSQMYVVVNASADMLKNAPAYDRMADAAGHAAVTAFVAPDVTRDGYTRVDGAEIATERFMGETVYDVNDTNVGTVTDMVIDDAGTGTSVIVDFGGFLGIGKSQVAVAYEELTFLVNADDDLRVYVDATKEQVQSRHDIVVN